MCSRHGVHRRIIGRYHRDRRIVIGAGTAIAVGQDIAHGAGTGCRRVCVGVLIGDVFYERGDRRRRCAIVERDDEIAPVAASGECANAHALVRDRAAAYADLSDPGPLVLDTEYIFGTVAAGRN